MTRNEKVEHHIRIKAHKPIALSFGLRVVSVSYVVRLRSHWCCISPVIPPLLKPDKWYQSRWLIPAQTSAASAGGGVYQCGWRDSPLRGEIVRNPSVSLSPTLTRNEKVEHYIRIKTHKPIVLRFWVENGVSVLCG